MNTIATADCAEHLEGDITPGFHREDVAANGNRADAWRGAVTASHRVAISKLGGVPSSTEEAAGNLR